MEAFGYGTAERRLTDAEIFAVCDRAAEDCRPDGRRILLIVPDLTRTCPLGIVFRRLYDNLAPRTRQLDCLMALGTHPAMSMEQIYTRMEITAEEHQTRFPKVRFFNHDWKNPDQLIQVGRLTKRDIHDITDGRFELDIDVTCSRRVQDYDLLLMIGPVFPHEVVGFSGGNKYLFPGISGPEVLNCFHWLGAVITSPVIIGNADTPVRRVVDRAAAMVPAERRALCMVVRGHDLAGLYTGTPEAAWADAAALSRQLHIEYRERPFQTVLSCAPPMYDDFWTAAKCMYKLEPVIADGGRVIVYAPHLSEISVTHGRLIEEIGYHVRDYFLAQWDRFQHYPWGVLAHSTHARGIGTYANGVERPRIDVILASRVPEATCRKINLGYMNPDHIQPADYQGREDEGVLFIPKAGEILYRWKDAPPSLGGPTPA